MLIMGTTLYGKMKWGLLKFDLNMYAGETLRYLGWGLKKKYGVYAPMPEADCKILARILRNKAGLFEAVADDPSHMLQEYSNLYMWMNGKKDYMTSGRTIQWIRRLADFFDKIRGLVDIDGNNEE
jgi:hypothetical protein